MMEPHPFVHITDFAPRRDLYEKEDKERKRRREERTRERGREREGNVRDELRYRDTRRPIPHPLMGVGRRVIVVIVAIFASIDSA